MNLTYISHWNTDRIIVFFLREFFYSIFVLSLVMIYPFYTYVFQLNREKEKLTAVYPIMSHYHKMLKFILVQGVIMTIYHFQYLVKDLADDDQDDYENENLTIWSALKEGFLMLYYFVNQYFLHLFTRVHCLLISIVTLQRFLLYFIPSTEPYVNMEQKTMSVFIKCIYAITSIFVLGFLTLDRLELVPSMAKVKTLSLISPFGWLYFSVDFAFFLTSILYIPILISIRKHSHLASFIQNKPHKYVFYQCSICIVLKTTHYPLAFYMFYGLGHSIDPILEFSVEMDYLNTTLIVQASYLFCNRRNVETLFSKELLRHMCHIGPSRNNNQVHPANLEVVYSTNRVIG